MERLGMLLGDLIDSKDDGGSVSCSNHTNDQGWKVSDVVDEKEETEVVVMDHGREDEHLA